MTIKPDFLKVLQADPQRVVNVIVTTTSDPSANSAKLESMGLTVTRTYSLTPTLAASGPAQVIIDLSAEPWVATIEPDGPVHTMG